MKVSLLLTLIFSTLFISACGKKLSDKKPQPQIDSIEPEGIYSATLTPINYQSGKKQTVIITKYGDEFRVKVKFRSGPEGMHRQGLYSGTVCPHPDTNGDGYIDMAESETLTGQLIIPFDGDLSASDLGNGNFPHSTAYDYENSTSYYLMQTGLPHGHRNLQIQGKIVLIQGMKEGELLPIACGILSQSVITPNEEPEPPRVRPRPTRPYRPPEVEPKPPEPPRRRTLWERIRDRVGGWWSRVRGEGRGGKP